MKRYKVGPLHLDIEQRILYSGSEVVSLSPKSFDILLVLVENAGQVISRDAIREQVWGDAFIEDANLSNNISMVRSALRPFFGDAQVIKTFSKRGYQFTVTVELEDGERRDSSAERRAVPADPSAPAPLPVAKPAFVWKTRGHLLLVLFFVAGLLFSLGLLRFARTNTVAHHPVASVVLNIAQHGADLLKAARPFPSLASALVMFGVAAILTSRGRFRPDLYLVNWAIALVILGSTQIIWAFAQETSARHTISMLGQVMLALLLAAYRPHKVSLKASWLLYVDLLPLLIFIVCCGLDVKKASVYVVLSAVGRMMLIGSYLLRRDAWLPVGISILGWISMALLAADGRFLAAGYLAIAVGSLYAAVNITLRLPRENVGKPILVAGLLAWAIYAATYPAAYNFLELRPFWTLLLMTAKLLVCAGMAVFILRARPDRRRLSIPEELASAA